MYIYDVYYVGSKSRISAAILYIMYVCAGDVCLQTLHETSLRFDFAGYQITTERLNFRRFQVVYIYIMYFSIYIIQHIPNNNNNIIIIIRKTRTLMSVSIII
jgi:hypothetical protein